MPLRWDGFLPLVLVVTVAGCLTAACGGGPGTHPGSARTSATASPSATSATSVATTPVAAASGPDPLAGLSAAKIAAEADANFNAAATLSWDGTLSSGGGIAASKIGYKRGRGCTGTVRLSTDSGKNRGSYRFTAFMPGDGYLSPDATFWANLVQQRPNLANKYPQIKGKYLEFLPGDPVYSALDVPSSFCDLTEFTPWLTGFETITKSAVATLGGSQVLPLKASAQGTFHATIYVTDTIKPQLVKVAFTWSAGSGINSGGNGTYTFSVGAPVALTAPPPSQVIAAASLGL